MSGSVRMRHVAAAILLLSSVAALGVASREQVCAGYSVIGAGESRCGITLSKGGVLELDGRPVEGMAKLPVSSGVPLSARSVVADWSPDGRYAFLQACIESAGRSCRTCFVLDRDQRDIVAVEPRFFCDVRGRVAWSADGRRSIYTDGYASGGAAVALDLASGRIDGPGAD